jgi:hypothetical protein
VRIYKNSLVNFLRRFEIDILDSNIKIKTFFQLKFMKKLVALGDSSLDKIDNAIIEFPVVERLLEGVLKIFLQFDSEYWIIPVECMLVYGIMQELDNYIDSRRNRHPLSHMKKEWMFEHRQMWKHEREVAAIEGRPPVRFIAKQPNVVNNTLIRELSINSNTLSVSPPKRIIRRSTQEIERDNEVKRLSVQLNNLSFRSIEVSTNDKRIEYFPEEDLIVKGSGSIEDPFDVADDDTDIYSDDENPKIKKIANKMVDHTLDKKKPGKEKLKVRKLHIRHRVTMPGDSKRKLYIIH